MLKRGHLDVPVIGVAKAGWNLDKLKARAKESLGKHGGLDPALKAGTPVSEYSPGTWGRPRSSRACRPPAAGRTPQ
jgi:glucose-6-phosphate 1-dehydrogenase